LMEHLKRVWGSWLKGWWQTGLAAPFSRRKLPRPTVKILGLFFLELLVALAGWFWWGTVWLAFLIVFPFSFLFASGLMAVLDRLVVEILSRWASRIISDWRGQGTKIIGVTGSFGKTTTVAFLAALLGGENKVFSPPEGTNVDKAIITSIIKNRAKRPATAIFELGAYKKGEIAALSAWLKPEIAVVTGVGRQHLALFGSGKNLYQAKKEILAFAQTAFFNADNAGSRKMAKKFAGRRILYGQPARADYRLTEFRAQTYFREGRWRAEQTFTVKHKIKIWSGKVNFLSSKSLLNLTGAIAVADFLGFSRRRLVAAFPRLKLPQGRQELITGKKGALVIASCHNQSEASIKAIIALIKTLGFKNKIVILNEIIELGEKAEAVHQRLGDNLARAVDKIYVVGDRVFAWLTKGAKVGKDKFTLINQEEIGKILAKADKNTVIFLSGRGL